VPRPAVGETGKTGFPRSGHFAARSAAKKGAHRKESRNKTSNIEADINFCRWKI